MNFTPTSTSDLTRDLQGYQTLCEEALGLVTRENQALAAAAEFRPAEFCRLRKDLIPRLETAFTMLRGWRQHCQQFRPAQRPFGPEIKSLFQAIQSLLMRILLLDRENQQALLRRGLVPSHHLPPAGGQQPGFVASLYRRYSGV